MMRYRPKVLKSGSNPRRARHFLDNVVEFALVVQAEEYIIFLYHVPLRVRWPALQAEETSSTLVHGTISGCWQSGRCTSLLRRFSRVQLPGNPPILSRHPGFYSIYRAVGPLYGRRSSSVFRDHDLIGRPPFDNSCNNYYTLSSITHYPKGTHEELRRYQPRS